MICLGCFLIFINIFFKEVELNLKDLQKVIPMKILVTDPIHEDGLEQLREFAEVDMAIGLKQEELIKRVTDFDILVVRSATKVTREVLEAAKELKLVVRAGVGLDNIDLKAAKERGINVANTPEAPSIAVAELVMGLMLSWARKIPQADAGMKQEKWEKKQLMGTELRGKTLGIIGTGRVGKEVGRRAKSFEMNLLAYDVVKDEEFAKEVAARYVDLETLLRESDYVTLHVPLIQQTKHMLGAREFELMKPTAVLVNVSRGGVVDEAALVEALRAGKIAGACLDVYEREPPKDSPLLGLPNVVLTPHIGASSKEAQRAAALLAAEKIKEYLPHTK